MLLTFNNYGVHTCEPVLTATTFINMTLKVGGTKDPRWVYACDFIAMRACIHHSCFRYWLSLPHLKENIIYHSDTQMKKENGKSQFNCYTLFVFTTTLYKILHSLLVLAVCYLDEINIKISNTNINDLTLCACFLRMFTILIYMYVSRY